VTLGTHLRWAKQGLVERIAHVARSLPGYHFVVSQGDLHAAAEDPVFRAANLSVYPYVSYDRHLDRFAAVVHHGGAGVAYSCLRAARPCLVWPCDYDQFDIAARLVARGAGLRIRRLGDAESCRQLARLLTDFDRGPLAALSAALARYDPHGACARVIDRLTESRRTSIPGRTAAPGAA